MTVISQTRPSETAPRLSDAAPIYLLDGHSLTFRAYYAVRGLTSPQGKPTNAVYGFLRMLLKLIEDQRPEWLAVIFDTGEPTFRKDLYAGYKMQREGPPPDFSDQMVWIEALLKALGIPVYKLVGYEADDLIATMAAESAAEGHPAMVVSADKDLFQLVDDKVKMLRFGSKDLELYDEAAVEKRLGVKPAQVPDWLAIVGDTSDNIPGVPGIGEKGATKLLAEYGSLENLLARAGEIKTERQRNSLIENAEQARLSLKLATVIRDVPFEWNFDECRVPESLWNDQSIQMLSDLGFDSIIKEKGLRQPEKTVAAVEVKRDEEYRIMSDVADLRAWVDEAMRAPWLGLDTETTGIDPMQAHLVGISLSIKPSSAIYIPVAHRVGPSADHQIPIETLREILNPLFSGSASPALTAHHAKYDWKILERAGFKLKPPRFDTLLAAFVLDPAKDSGHGLKALGSEMLGVRMTPITDIIGGGKNAITIDEVPVEAAFEYASRDADVTLQLTHALEEKLKALPTLDKLFNELEVPLIPVLHKMEVGGVNVDPSSLNRLSAVMSKEITRLAKEIHECAGTEFNIDSPKQMADVLFVKLGLPTAKKTKTGFSTDTSVLESLEGKHPIASLILEYRQLTKLKSTYADTLPQQINPSTRRIHTSYNQTIAQTGRLSSTNPNLQNIPIRSELGREIRRTFIPDSAKHQLVSADYSQIELRILAHMSGDETLRKAYQENRDIHALTASQIFGVEQQDVTSEMRARAKVVNFGIIYGMSAHGLSQRLQIPRADATHFITTYFATYPGVRRWLEETLEKGRRDGYVETLMGRRRWVPDLTAKNGQLRAAAERIAVNAPIQGTSADMIKVAMIEIDRELEQAAPGARMALQVHDELIFSVPREIVEPTGKFVAEKMRQALPLDVPIVVEVHSGDTWADC